MNEVMETSKLSTLGAEIRVLRRQGELAALSYGIEIGRKLTEAKALVPFGQWGKWLETEVDYSQSQAELYMKAYEGYGSDQQSIFGDAAPKVIEDLGFTKAVKLLAIPEPEREQFAEEVGAAELSTRELDKAIREYKKQAEDSRKAYEDEAEKNRRLQEKADAAKEEAQRLREEIQRLEQLPKEVVVEAPNEEILQQLREDAEKSYQEERERLQKKLEAAEKKAKTAEEKLEKTKSEAEEAAKKAAMDAANVQKKKLEEAESAAAAEKVQREAAEKRAKELEEKLKTADGEAAVFKVYFSGVQEDMNRMLGIIKKSGPEQAEKYKGAILALMEKIKEGLG